MAILTVDLLEITSSDRGLVRFKMSQFDVFDKIKNEENISKRTNRNLYDVISNQSKNYISHNLVTMSLIPHIIPLANNLVWSS